MSGRIGTCTFKTGVNEQIDAIAKLPRETRSCIFGTVVDEFNQPIVDAVVKLLEVTKEGCFPIPLTHTFTDENGQFLLGPLCPNRTYMLKIFKDNVSIVNKVLKLSCHKGSCIGVTDKCKSDC
jgi:hypothetical protein